MKTEEIYVDVLQGWAGRASGKVALTFLEDGELLERSVTYRVLDQRAREVAVGILERTNPGDRVLLLHPPGLEFVIAFFGCLYAGVVPVPAYPPRNPRHYSRIEAIIDDASAACVLTVSESADRIAAWLEEKGRKLPVVGSDRLYGGADAWRRPAYTAESLAFLQYTSGSTGQPKGVMISHGNLMANQRMIQGVMGHSEGLIEVSWLPIYHDMGLIGNLMQPLFLGGRCIFMSPVAFLQKPRRWLAAISRFRAQGTGGPNFAYKLCTRSISDEQKSGLDLSSVKVFYSGSEPINSSDLEEFAEAFRGTGLRREALYTCYGMAETTLVATGSTPDAGPRFETVDADALTRDVAVRVEGESIKSRTLVGCGKAVAGQRLAIVSETGKRLGDGRVGEIWLQGANVAQGYWGNPQLSQETFSAYLEGDGPYLRTGDLGYLRNGELFVTGRMKDVLIIRGKNHYPQDLEATVQRSHSAFALNGIAAFPVTDAGQGSSGGEELVVVGEIRRSFVRNLNPDEMFRAVRREVLAEHGLTVYAIVLLRPATLPRTSSGKIQRRISKARYEEGSLESLGYWKAAPYAQPMGTDWDWSTHVSSTTHVSSPHNSVDAAEVEQWLRNWIGKRLGCASFKVNPFLAFADFALDSLTSVALTSELSQWLQIEVSPTLVWDFPTIRLASDHLAGMKDTALPHRVAHHHWNNENIDIDQSAELLARELASLSEERPV